MDAYRFANGDTYGERPSATPSPLPPPPRRATLADRARVAARLAAQDPTWGQRTAESRRLLVNLALKENR